MLQLDVRHKKTSIITSKLEFTRANYAIDM